MQIVLRRSVIALQLALSPMMLVRIELPHLIAVQRLHDADGRHMHPGNAALPCVGQHLSCRCDRRHVAF